MKAILFFDGPCAMCNFTVEKVLKYQKPNLKSNLFFAPLQGETAKDHLPLTLREEPFVGIVLSLDGKILVGASAVRELGVFLRFPFFDLFRNFNLFLYNFFLYHRFLYNFFYDFFNFYLFLNYFWFK